MAKHDQQAARENMICSLCRNGAGCDKCIDVPRMKLGMSTRICQCQKRDHHDMVSGAGVISLYVEFRGVRAPSPGVPEGWE